MTPDRFAQVRVLWESALEQPVTEREAFLARAAPADPELRAEVMTLLQAHDATSGTFSGNAVLAAGLDFLDALPSLAGRRLGAYQVTREIGHGGMGTVYEAVRADDQFTKRVAIKTLRVGSDSAEVLRRFRRERQIQAALAHPNIATLLDAGATDERVPYIVLEYVDGLPIDVHCEQKRLGIAARLNLFQQVVRAVQHAHRQLVVHRDLKPSNILVTDDGVVKLLDFGISKLIGDDHEETLTGAARAFTTAYASPEQIRGEPISTATDIYSLGIVLFRLLTGANPFDLEGIAAATAWARICDQPPRALGAAATAATATAMGYASTDRLARALRGELEAIVLMALRKEPDRRYPTADALGEDLLNHLRGHPVQARPDSAGYRIRKLVTRNRLATAALAVAFLAMAVGTVAAVSQAREATAQARIAEAERTTATRVSGFLQKLFASADLSWAGQGLGPNTTIAETIDSATGKIDTELVDEPAAAEALHRILVSMYTARRNPARGEPHALRVLELLGQRKASNQEMARGLHDLGIQLYLAGRRDSSLALLEQAYGRLEADGFPETENLVFILNQLALLAMDAGDPPKAEGYMSRALEVHRRVFGDDLLAAIATGNVGVMRNAQGDLAGAERAFRQAEAIHASLAGGENYERGNNLPNLGGSLLLLGRIEEAERNMREAIAVYDRTIGPAHLVQGVGRINLSRLELADGRPTEALATVRRGIELLDGLPPEHPTRTGGGTQEAAILLALGRPAEAEPLVRWALGIRERWYPPGDWRTAETQGVLGQILLARGQSDVAIELLQSSHQNLSTALGPADPRTFAAERAAKAAGAGDGKGSVPR